MPAPVRGIFICSNGTYIYYKYSYLYIYKGEQAKRRGFPHRLTRKKEKKHSLFRVVVIYFLAEVDPMAQEIQNKRDVLSAQSMSVVKGNALIQKTHYSLSLIEQKAILYIISKIKPNDSGDTEYIFNIRDFCKACNFYDKSGFYYQYVRNVMEDLGNHKLTIEVDENQTLITHWFSGALIDRNAGEVRLHIDPYIRPYLFELNRFYTNYKLEYVLPMKSKYGIRLYEFLRSYQSKGYKLRWPLEEIRLRIDCEKYPNFKDFRVNVLEPALEDINTYTDIKVQYEAVKTGRKITHLEFMILTEYDRDLQRYHARREELGYRK